MQIRMDEELTPETAKQVVKDYLTANPQDRLNPIYFTFTLDKIFCAMAQYGLTFEDLETSAEEFRLAYQRIITSIANYSFVRLAEGSQLVLESDISSLFEESIRLHLDFDLDRLAEIQLELSRKKIAQLIAELTESPSQAKKAGLLKEMTFSRLKPKLFGITQKQFDRIIRTI